MQDVEIFNNFYSGLNKITAINQNLDKERDNLFSIIKKFNDKIQDITLDNNIKEKNKDLGEILEQTLIKLKKSSNIWVDEFKKILQQEKFRNKLKNNFIVIVFGKVKAGKSSLGNFIAKNNTTSDKATFFIYDEAGTSQDIKELKEIEGEDEFATDNLECTKSIQGFELNCLAWIDTPGLGSMVKANGDLAKEYINSADYIIFPANSGEPETKDNIDAIKELIECNKKLTIIITRSDTTERRKDSEGKFIRDESGKIGSFLVNKDDERRKSQEDSFIKKIEDTLGCSDNIIGNIFSLSVHTAKKGLESNDVELFEKSNIPKLYELMTDIVENKVSELKSSSAFDGLISFIDNTLLGNKSDNLNSIKSLLNTISYFDEKILESKKRFEDIKKNTNSDITSNIEYLVSLKQSEIKKGNEKEMLNSIDVNINTSVSEIIQKNVEEILSDFTVSIDKMTTMLNSTDEFIIKDKYKTVEVSYKDNGITNLWGLFGDRYKYMEESVFLGDNTDEIIKAYKQTRIYGFIKMANDNYDIIIKSFFIPLETVSKQMREQIRNLVLEVEEQKEHLNKRN
ncbi:MAG: GTPase [Aliarcobacter sp.]|jgi:tRNA U34 5-carboxymethylaminomethyl modifying GTPase MnmE/TrmE|nr:GTPase [Aliarcobacter sp.]